MNKIIIDKVFTDEYNNLIDYCSKAIKIYNRPYDATLVIAECYIYLINYDFGITTEYKHVVAMSKHWCKQNIRWANGPLNLKFTNSNHFELLDNMTHTTAEIDSDSIQYTIDTFYNSLTSYDKGLFRMYYHQELTTATKIKQHLKISYGSAYTTVQECKQLNTRFIQYVKNLLT